MKGGKIGCQIVDVDAGGRHLLIAFHNKSASLVDQDKPARRIFDRDGIDLLHRHRQQFQLLLLVDLTGFLRLLLLRAGH